MKKEIVIYGIGDFARLMHFYFSRDSKYNVAGFCVDQEHFSAEEYMDLPVRVWTEIQKEWTPDKYDFLVAIGYKDMGARERIVQRVKDSGYQMVNYISRDAQVEGNVNIGQNNIIMPNVYIGPFVSIGDNNVFWPGCVVSHDIIIGSHNYMAPGCLISGNVQVKDLCFLGTGSRVSDGVSLANYTRLLPGAVLQQSTVSNKTYGGIPAVVLKDK